MSYRITHPRSPTLYSTTQYSCRCTARVRAVRLLYLLQGLQLYLLDPPSRNVLCMIPTLVRREIPDPAPCVFLVGVLQYRGVFDRPPHFPYLQKPTTLRLNDEPGFLPVPFLRQKGAHEKWKSTDDGSEKENDEPLSSKTFLLRTLFPTYPLYLPWHPSWKRCSAALALPSAGGCAWDQRRVD